MAEYYFSVNLDQERTLCLAPMSDRLLSLCDLTITDPSGYFLYERRGAGDFPEVEIIAHVPTDEGALRLRQMFSMG